MLRDLFTNICHKQGLNKRLQYDWEMKLDSYSWEKILYLWRKKKERTNEAITKYDYNIFRGVCMQ